MMINQTRLGRVGERGGRGTRVPTNAIITVDGSRRHDERDDKMSIVDSILKDRREEVIARDNNDLLNNKR